MWREETRRTRKKALGARLNPIMTYSRRRIQTPPTLVVGERSNLCAVPTPMNKRVTRDLEGNIPKLIGSSLLSIQAYVEI